MALFLISVVCIWAGAATMSAMQWRRTALDWQAASNGWREIIATNDRTTRNALYTTDQALGLLKDDAIGVKKADSTNERLLLLVEQLIAEKRAALSERSNSEAT